MKKLAALLTLFGVVVVGGSTFYLAAPKQGVVVAQLIDAGINTLCNPRIVECKVRNRCGATDRYAVVQTKVMVCSAGAASDDKVVIFRWPRVGNVRCWEPVGPPDEACRVVGAGCSDGTLCVEGDELPVAIQTPQCACTSGASCTWTSVDGGSSIAAPRLRTLDPGTWAGAGCVTKYCGPELAGEQNTSFPAGCPP